MCNGANHTSGCECGFGPPYQGTITRVNTVGWIERAAQSKADFKRTLNEFNLDETMIRKFIRDYYDVETSPNPSSKIEKFKHLIRRLKFKEENRKIIPVTVPLFKLHSPSVKGAKVIYRESGAPRQRGWFVTVFGQGTGSTNTYKVVYESTFESINGECRQVYVPIDLEVKSIGAYESGTKVGMGVHLSVQGIERDVLRKRGCDLLDEEECGASLEGDVQTKKYNLKRETKPYTEDFSHLWGNHLVDRIELETISAFNTTITPLAELEHLHILDLTFKLPGKRNYDLRYNNSGLHWTVS